MKRKALFTLVLALMMAFCTTAVVSAADELEPDGTIYPYGVYEPTSFELVSGGSGRVTLSCDKIHITSRIYADITISSANYDKATVAGVEYEPFVDQTAKTSTFRVPVNANKDTVVTAHTTSMGGADINYTVKVGVDKDNLKAAAKGTYQDGSYTTVVSSDRKSYGYRTDKTTGAVTQVGINYPNNDYQIPVTVQIKDGKIANVAYTVDPLEYDMGNTSSDFNYLLWAMNGRNVSDFSYNYLNKSGANYDSYNLSPHPAKNGTGMSAQIVEKNGVTGVDTVTSATLTSRAIIDSVDQSLTKAERGEKDDPEPALPQPDTSEDIIPADGLYLVTATSCKGTSLFNNNEVVIRVKDGKMTAEMLYVEERLSSYPYLFIGSDDEAVQAGEDAWLKPVELDYGGTLSSGKFAGGSLYTGVSLKSLDKQLVFLMNAKSSGNWFNRSILLDSSTLVKITEAALEQKNKEADLLKQMALMKTPISPLVYDELKKGTATAEGVTAEKEAISTLVDEVMSKVDAAKAGFAESDVTAVEAAASALKATLAKSADELLADQDASANELIAGQDALYDAVALTIENSDKAIREAAAKKADSKLKVTPVKKTYKVKALKKKAASFKAVTVKKAAGEVTYSAKAANSKSKKVLSFNKKTAKITVKKGTKKGTYKMKVTVKDAGSDTTEGKTITKTVTVKVK